MRGCAAGTSEALLERGPLLLGCPLLLGLDVVEVALGLGARHQGLRGWWLRHFDGLYFVPFEGLLVWDRLGHGRAAVEKGCYRLSSDSLRDWFPHGFGVFA